jgi:hypothetical protein
VDEKKQNKDLEGVGQKVWACCMLLVTRHLLTELLRKQHQPEGRKEERGDFMTKATPCNAMKQ